MRSRPSPAFSTRWLRLASLAGWRLNKNPMSPRKSRPTAIRRPVPVRWKLFASNGPFAGRPRTSTSWTRPSAIVPAPSAADRCRRTPQSGSSTIRQARSESESKLGGTRWPEGPLQRKFCAAKTTSEAVELFEARSDLLSFWLNRLSQKILLGEFDAAMAQDVIRRRDVEKELRHAEGQQQ